MAKPRSGMVKSNLFIDPKVQRGLQFLAERRGTTYSALVREAMRAFLIDALKEEKEVAELEANSEIVEIAVQLRPVPEILKQYDLSRKDLVRKLKDPMFRDMVRQAKSLWNSDLSVKERIRLKSQILVEDSILEIFSMVHNRDNAIPARLDAFKQLARVAEVDSPDRSNADTGSRFTVSINLGEKMSPVIIEGDSNG
jgi:predicted transcriptional regulator